MPKRTTKPISVLVIGLSPTPELEAMAATGHTIQYENDPEMWPCEGVDMVVGPKCWRLLPDQMKWLPLMLKEARAAQPKVKKAKKERKSDPV